MSTLNQAYRQYALILISSLMLTIVGTMMGDWFVGYWKMPLLPFIISLFLLIAIRFMKNPMKTWMFFLFSFLEGISLTPIVYYYLATDNQVLVSAITVTTLLVGICLVLGHRAKNLAPMGVYLFIGLIGLLLLSVIEIFLPISIPFLGYFGIAIFTGYIVYNINLFKRRLDYCGGHMSSEEVTDHVMSQYLNILNLFLDVLRVMDRD